VNADGKLAVLLDEPDADPGEATRQLAQLLPDLVDALTPGGELLSAPELARLMRIDVVLDDESAGAFGQ
jgi:uncharacterized protein YidB (DUF937 family)